MAQNPAALPADQSVNTAQVNGVTTLTGTGAVGTGAQRVAVGTDTATIAGSAPGTAGTPSANVITTQTPNADPCSTTAHTYKPISITSATTTNIVTNGATKKIYICQLIIATGVGNNVAVIEGTTGGTCSGPAGVLGGTTVANGFNFAANGGVSLGNGMAAIAQTATNDNDLCIITSSAGPLAGGITYVVQ
jgi:hypothetical protein